MKNLEFNESIIPFFIPLQMFGGNAINFQAIFFPIISISTNRFGQIQIYLPQNRKRRRHCVQTFLRSGRRSDSIRGNSTRVPLFSAWRPTQYRNQRNFHWFTIAGNFRREQFTFNGRPRPRTSNSLSRRIMTFEIFGGRFDAIAGRFHWNLLLLYIYG